MMCTTCKITIRCILFALVCQFWVHLWVRTGWMGTCETRQHLGAWFQPFTIYGLCSSWGSMCMGGISGRFSSVYFTAAHFRCGSFLVLYMFSDGMKVWRGYVQIATLAKYGSRDRHVADTHSGSSAVGCLLLIAHVRVESKWMFKHSLGTARWCGENGSAQQCGAEAQVQCAQVQCGAGA